MAGKISNKVSRAIQLLIMASIAIMLSTAKAAAQNAFDKGTPAESKGGMSGLSTYAQDKVETVNLANGNLNVHIPLVTIGGRGSASYTVALNYNSKLWSGQHNLELRQDAFDQTVLIKVHHFGATFDNLLGNTPNTLFLGAGWSILKGPAIKVQRVDIDPVDCSNVRGDTLYKYVLTKVWVVLPDGSEIEMRDDVSDGAPYLIPNVCDPNNRADRYRGRVWHSTDGSAMTYITDVDDGVVTGQLGGYVYLADGTRMRMTMPQLSGSARCTKIIDPNGNVLDINYNKVFEQSGVQGAVTYRDQLGRQVAVQSTPDGMSVTIRGYNNEVADRVINVRTGLIAPDDNTLAAPNLREDFRDTVAWPRPFISGDYSNTTAGVEEHSVYGTSPHKDLFPPSDVDVGMAKISGELDQQGNPVDGLFVVTRLDLLDGRSFKFRYNPYGELAEIEYPGGGISKINYAPAPEGSGMCEAGGPIKALLKRRVVERRTFSDGSTADTVWSYSWTRPPAPDFPTVTVQARQASTNALLMDETHYFLALDAEYRTCVPSTGATMLSGNIKWENAKEFKVERRTGTGTQTETRNWTQRAAQSWGNDPNSSVNAYRQEHGQEQSANDDRVNFEDNQLENGKLKRVEYGYSNDKFNNVTSIKEYDFGQGAAGNLLRETLRSYVTSLNGYCYTNLLGTGSCINDSVSTDPAAIIHKRRLLLSETVKDGAGNLEAYTEAEYDNYQGDGAGHAAMQTNTAMIQYDPTWFTPFAIQFQPRGNLTRVKRLISGAIAGGSYATSYSQYDEAGNIVKTIDPRGNATTISYADNFGDGSNPDFGTGGVNGATFAMPTTVTNALGHQVKTQYSYSRGVATGVKDANGVITRSEYDIYDRPTRVTAALGLTEQAVTEMSYPTASANESRVSKQLDATRWLTSKTIFDGLGRAIQVSQSEDGKHFNSFPSYTIHTKTIYDGLGRGVKTTNPYRSTSAASTDGWTRTSFDLAGRVTEVASFGGDVNSPPPDAGTAGIGYSGSVVTTYNSEQTTVRDQAGKQRRSTIDGLGRLKTVEELFDNGSLYATTSYSYDARGNLTVVSQNNNGTPQTRRFAYDGLSRLIFAANPEQTTIADPLFSYNSQQWAMKYEYDAASNLTAKTDTRKDSLNQFVRIEYSYDGLNRATLRHYVNASPFATPDVSYQYDTATNGKGRLASVTASGVSTYNYTAYDALGRLTQYNQVSEGQTYFMSNEYNKAGMMTSQTYPSQKKVVTEYDSAGRIAGVKNNASTGYYAGAAANDSLNRMQYTAAGAVSAMRLGNNLWEHTSFNSRMQPVQIGLGTAQTNSSALGLDYSYGASSSTNNGNIASQTITINQTTQIKQSYGYDHLNRLLSVQEVFGNEATPRWTQSYGYDVVGNRTALTNTGSEGGQLPTQTTPPVNAATNRLSTGYSYDNAGNMTGDAAGNSYVYDAENRLVKYNGTGGQYSYDGDGRRVKKQVGTVTTIFVYNVLGQLIAEYDSNTAAAPLTVTKYVTADHLGSTRVVTDSTGAVKARYDYLPFGEEISAGIGSRSTLIGYSQADGLRQKFTSKERDMESGLDFFVNRYFSSAQGRFTSVDPLFVNLKRLIDLQRLNLYAYTRNNPLKYTDPDGVDLLIAAKNEEEARKKYDLLAKGLAKEDRAHVHFVVGNGKNGFAKGTFAVTVDKDYKSESENFQTVQKIANAKDVAVLSVVGPKDQITVLQAVPRRDGKGLYLKPIPGVTFSFNTLGNPFAGYTFFPVVTKPTIPFMSYSTSRRTQSYVANDTADEEISATIHHELRHIVLGDFGRTIAKSIDGQPDVDKQTKAAEDEAKKNFKSP